MLPYGSITPFPDIRRRAILGIATVFPVYLSVFISYEK